jgi:hypothetical protein
LVDWRKWALDNKCEINKIRRKWSKIFGISVEDTYVKLVVGPKKNILDDVSTPTKNVDELYYSNNKLLRVSDEGKKLWNKKLQLKVTGKVNLDILDYQCKPLPKSGVLYFNKKFIGKTACIFVLADHGPIEINFDGRVMTCCEMVQRNIGERVSGTDRAGQLRIKKYADAGMSAFVVVI